MKKLSYVSVVLLFMIMAACSGDDDEFVVSRASVYGDWTAKEVNIDGTWIDTKKAKQSFFITLTEDGFWISQLAALPYEINGDVVECYDEKKTTIKTLIRFTSIEGSNATAIISWPASGKRLEARMERDANVYNCRVPSSYLSGVWEIIGSKNGGTVSFDNEFAEIKDGAFSLKGSYGRYPLRWNRIIIYKMNGDYREEQSRFFFVEPRGKDAHVDTIGIWGSESISQYSSMRFVCVRK